MSGSENPPICENSHRQNLRASNLSWHLTRSVCGMLPPCNRQSSPNCFPNPQNGSSNREYRHKSHLFQSPRSAVLVPCKSCATPAHKDLPDVLITFFDPERRAAAEDCRFARNLSLQPVGMIFRQRVRHLVTVCSDALGSSD